MTTEKTISANVKILYEKFWKQSEPKGKSVYNITNTGRATIKTLEMVAERSGIPIWYLLIPLPEEILLGHDLDELVSSFIKSSPETRSSVLHILRTLNK